MHFQGGCSSNDEWETTKNTTSLSHREWKSTRHAARIATSSKQRFWKLTLKIILALFGMALTCLLGLNVLISTSSQRSEVWTGLGQTEGEQNEFQMYFGLRTKKRHISHFASKVQCNGQQFACSEWNRHFNIFQLAHVCRMAAIRLVADTELRDRPQLGNNMK